MPVTENVASGWTRLVDNVPGLSIAGTEFGCDGIIADPLP
jgi:hypothetical protein